MTDKRFANAQLALILVLIPSQAFSYLALVIDDSRDGSVPSKEAASNSGPSSEDSGRSFENLLTTGLPDSRHEGNELAATQQVRSEPWIDTATPGGWSSENALQSIMAIHPHSVAESTALELSSIDYSGERPGLLPIHLLASSPSESAIPKSSFSSLPTDFKISASQQWKTTAGWKPASVRSTKDNARHKSPEPESRATTGNHFRQGGLLVASTLSTETMGTTLLPVSQPLLVLLSAMGVMYFAARRLRS